MDTLGPGEQLQLNQTLQSANGAYTLVMQGDGDLVLYSGWPQAPIAHWTSVTAGLPPDQRPVYAEMQADGNFVLYDSSRRAPWASNTAGHPGARITLQDDRNLVLYDATGAALWATGTDIAQPDDYGKLYLTLRRGLLAGHDTVPSPPGQNLQGFSV